MHGQPCSTPDGNGRQAVIGGWRHRVDRHGTDAARNVMIAPNVIVDAAVTAFAKHVALDDHDRALFETQRGWLSPLRKRSERIEVARFKCPRPVPGTGIITGGATMIGSGSGSSSRQAWHRRQLLLEVRN